MEPGAISFIWSGVEYKKLIKIYKNKEVEKACFLEGISKNTAFFLFWDFY